MTSPTTPAVNILRAVKDNIDTDIEAVETEIESHEVVLDDLYTKLATLKRVKRKVHFNARSERTVEAVLPQQS